MNPVKVSRIKNPPGGIMMAVLNIKNKYLCEMQKAGWCGGGVNDHHMCSVQEAVVLFSAFFSFHLVFG